MARRLAQIEESVQRYLHQLDSADRQEPSLGRTTKTARLHDKIAKLKEEMTRLGKLESERLAAPDRQISLSAPDARSMATSGRGSGMVCYNLQSAVDTKHHLIVAHEVTNEGSDRGQLSNIGEQAKAALYRRRELSNFVSPLSRSDGHDCLGLIDELVPGLATGLNDGVVIFKDAVREPVLSEVLPDVLDRV